MISKSYISDVLINGLGVTLVNSLWQGLLIVLLLNILLYVLPKNRVQLKYWLSVTALTAVVFWAGYTFSQEVVPMAEYAPSSKGGIVGMMTGAQFQLTDFNHVANIKSNLDQWLFKLQPYMDTMVVIWMIGVLFFLIRLQGSMIYLNRIKVMGTRPAPLAWQRKVEELSDKLGIKSKVKILESTLAEIPMVIGHLKPVILLPIGMITGLTSKEVEAILAHELAHIKRFDYLINIAQTVVESLLFFNPAVWWISQSIRKHREHCCDDIAVKYCENQLEYANALSNLGVWSIRTPALGMGLFKNKNELLMRIKRLVYPQVGNRTLKEKLVPGIVLLLTVVCLSWYSHRVQAQLMPVQDHIESNMISASVAPIVQVADTIPDQKSQPVEALPPMEPDTEFETEFEASPDVDMDIDTDIDFGFAIPDMEVLMEAVIAPMPDLEALTHMPDVMVDVHEIIDMEEFRVAMDNFQMHFNDTTRERIRKAMEEQLEAMEQAKAVQSEALEKAREHLRESLDGDRPEELTDEEWELAKDQLRRAERSLEEALRQSEKALDHAFNEHNFEIQRSIERAIRDVDREELVHRHVERIQRDQARVHRDMARAQKHGDRYSYRYQWKHPGKESLLRDSLVEDGLISRRDSDITLTFKKDLVKINGVKLEGTVKQKYRKLLDEIYGENSSGELQFSD